MAAQLVIRDGSPHWWNSPDIWVVPGNDPNGAPGSPIAGEPSFLWARVQNTGDVSVSGARVNFYWSNPATGVLRSTSYLVGNSSVSLNAGETKEVLCVIPWIPIVVNSGHECLVAEVIHSSDPLPSPLLDNFNPPAYRQVAQKNITVLVAARQMMMAIQIAAPKREDKTLFLRIETGGKLTEVELYQLGLKGFRPGKVKEINAGFSPDAGCDQGDKKLKKVAKMDLKKGTSKAIYLSVPPVSIEPGSYALLHVIATDGNKKSFGGISYLLINQKKV